MVSSVRMKKHRLPHLRNISDKKWSFATPCPYSQQPLPLWVCTLFSAAGLPPTPTRTDVDSCFQALPVNHFWFFCTLELCAPGHPHLLEVLRDAGWFTAGAPSCWEGGSSERWPLYLFCFWGLAAWLPGGKRKQKLCWPPCSFSSTKRALTVQIQLSGILLNMWLYLGLLIKFKASCMTYSVDINFF